MASIPGARFDISGASGSQGLLAPKDGWRAFFLPRGAYTSQDSTGTLITFDSANVASRFAVNDWIQVGTNTANIRQVGAVGGNSISISGANLTVTENDRVFLIGSTEPTVSGNSATYTPNTYVRQRDDDAATLYTNSMVTTNTNGLVQAFAGTSLYDVMLQDGNHANQGYIANLAIGVPEGVSVSDASFFGNSVTIYGTLHSKRGPGSIRWADEFATGSLTGGIQEAIDDLPAMGGVVMCSGITYTVQGTTAGSATIWMHSNVALYLGGGNILRGSTSLTTAAALIDTCAKGSNGTLPTAAGTLSNISVIGPGIVDGNETNFSSNVGVGISFRFTDGVFSDAVRVQNCEQDGYAFNECKNVRVPSAHIDTVGQAASVTSRNGISLYNNGNTWPASNRRYAFGNLTMNNIGDEAITFYGVSDVTVSSLVVDGCDTALEFQNHALGAPTGSIVCGNVVAKNCRQEPIYFSLTQGTTGGISHVTINNMIAHGSTAHSGGAILMVANVAQGITVTDIKVSNYTCSDINNLDTTGSNWVNIQTGTANFERLHFDNFLLNGKTSSVRTTDTGLTIKGNVVASKFNEIKMYNVAGFGTNIGGIVGLTATMRNIRVNDLVVDTCNSVGCFVGPGGASGHSMSDIQLHRPLVRNSCMHTESRAYLIQTGAAGTISRVKYVGPRIQNSGSSMSTAMRIDASSATLFDQIEVIDPDFANIATIATSAGTPTNVHWRVVQGVGTSISTAATISIPLDGDVFHVSGVTTVANGITVNPWDKGRRVKLIFDNNPTITDTGTSVLAGNVTGSTNGSLVITCDGTNWNEDCRSAN